MATEKTCACGNPLPSPRHTYCPDCRQARKKEQHRAFCKSDKFKAWRKEYLAKPENRAKNNVRAKAWYEAHAEELKAISRQRAKDNPEEHRRRCREYKRRTAIHTCYRCHMPYDRQDEGRICPDCLSQKDSQYRKKTGTKLSLKARMEMLREALNRRRAA